jgi:hypothetical protein
VRKLHKNKKINKTHVSTIFTQTVLFCSVLFCSCSKMTEDAQPKQVGAATKNESSKVAKEVMLPTVRNGRLHFNDAQHFNSYIASLHKLKVLPTKSIQGFTSRYDLALQESKFSDTTNPSDSLIQDNVFASVLNKDYEMSVENWIYKAGGDYCFLYKEVNSIQNIELMNKAKRGEFNIQEGQVYKQDSSFIAFATINKTFSGGKQLKKGNDVKQTLATRGITDYYEDRRIKMEMWESGWYFYASAGAETVMSRKDRSCFLWWCWDSWVSANAQQIGVSSDYRVFSQYHGEDFPVYTFGVETRQYTNASDAEIVFNWNSATVGYPFIIRAAPRVRIDYANTLHTCRQNFYSRTYQHSW